VPHSSVLCLSGVEEIFDTRNKYCYPRSRLISPTLPSASVSRQLINTSAFIRTHDWVSARVMTSYLRQTVPTVL
jgi:hypothetical protein